jgi:hypothetical protein
MKYWYLPSLIIVAVVALAGVFISFTHTQPGNTADTVSSAALEYPSFANSEYVRTTEWPPTLLITNTVFSCTQSDTTHEVHIGNHTFCVTTQNEGAAGSTYTTYTYTFAYTATRTATLSFTVQFVQCLNYDSPQQQECQRAQAAFAPDTLANAIMQTTKQK